MRVLGEYRVISRSRQAYPCESWVVKLNPNRLSRPAVVAAVAMNLIKTVANNSNKAGFNFHAGNTAHVLKRMPEIRVYPGWLMERDVENA